MKQSVIPDVTTSLWAEFIKMNMASKRSISSWHPSPSTKSTLPSLRFENLWDWSSMAGVCEGLRFGTGNIDFIWGKFWGKNKKFLVIKACMPHTKRQNGDISRSVRTQQGMFTSLVEGGLLVKHTLHWPHHRLKAMHAKGKCLMRLAIPVTLLPRKKSESYHVTISGVLSSTPLK